jgi:hypothetical protein
LNTTFILQDAAAGTEVLQVLLCKNRPGFAPESVILVMGSAVLAVFVTVINSDALGL